MNILQINGYQSPGRRFNGLALKPYLAVRGVSSKHLVWEQDRVEEDVISLTNPYLRKLNRFLRGAEIKLSLQSQLYVNGRAIRQLPEFKEADVIHYHIIHSGFLSMQSLPALTALKPAVWTLHDPWALTGHCVHPFSCTRWQTGCGQCPNLDTDFKIEKDTTALNFKLKKFAYTRSHFEVVVASAWMERLVRQSPLFHDVPIHTIPFGLDLEYFKARDSLQAKERLGIEPERLVVCFRSVMNDFKGTPYVLQALEKLRVTHPLCLLTLNDKGWTEQFKDRYQIVELGWTNDDELMRDVYDATDLFLMPSLADSFGMMAVEAMAFGKPTICFEGTALPEVTFAPRGAIAVPSKDATALCEVMARLLNSPDERTRLGQQARQLTEQHYDINTQATRLADVYRTLHATRHRKLA